VFLQNVGSCRGRTAWHPRGWHSLNNMSFCISLYGRDHKVKVKFTEQFLPEERNINEELLERKSSSSGLEN
jgi:hypothetical protein